MRNYENCIAFDLDCLVPDSDPVKAEFAKFILQSVKRMGMDTMVLSMSNEKRNRLVVEDLGLAEYVDEYMQKPDFVKEGIQPKAIFNPWLTTMFLAGVTTELSKLIEK